ncbi:hypothetical protein AVEN_95870-1 [Araneus ventricosus]|uniref:Uncharacterized protein n=1 Tax=Araneus ventricosus TaxID=182803 RepID=A0A4Y2N937_ARAVE|nr:hypothetical protein AVEN_95870-1 [Araneus ventricosus]
MRIEWQRTLSDHSPEDCKLRQIFYYKEFGPLDFFMWDLVKDYASEAFANTRELKHGITAAIHSIAPQDA